jgi:hypothetical protein
MKFENSLRSATLPGEKLKKAHKQGLQPGLRAKYQPKEVPMGMVVEVSRLRITPTKQETVRTVHGFSPLHLDTTINARKCQGIFPAK